MVKLYDPQRERLKFKFNLADLSERALDETRPRSHELQSCLGLSFSARVVLPERLSGLRFK